MNNMKLEVGMYVRTNDGTIYKNYGGGTNFFGDEVIYVNGENNLYDSVINANIKKSSSNLIDLIEVGDYVNGCKVTKINIKCPIINNKGVECKQEDKSNGYEGICFTYDNYDIKSILTKEQFEQNCYKVENER